jgi:hypothetical protein
MALQQPNDLSWVPESCTLPTVEQPLRVAEFDGLFRRAIDVTRPGLTCLQLTLPAEPAVAAAAAGLAARETRCCSFFTFTMTVTSQQLELTIAVPTGQVDVLDVLSARIQVARAQGAPAA